MYSLNTIIAMQDDNTVNAKKKKLIPYIAVCNRDKNVFKCPNLGYYLPKGFKFTQKYFVDNSGFGSDAEPALTVSQFVAKVRGGYGYAICKEGQFQVYIQEYKRV